jgi:hypothetical protein
MLSAETRGKLEQEIGAFTSYLESVGFPALEHFPIIGTSPGKVPSWGPGELYFGEESLGDGSAIRASFGMYYFNSQFVFGQEPDSARNTAAGIYNVYFLESYSDLHERRNGTPSEQWVDALWDIRNSFGKRVTDSGLYLGFAKRGQIVKIGSTNDYLRNMVETGMFEISNDKKEGLDSVREILSAHGLMQKSQSKESVPKLLVHPAVLDRPLRLSITPEQTDIVCPTAAAQAVRTASSWNLIAVATVSTTKIARTTSCVILNGGSDCVGAIAFSGGTFRNNCTIKTKTFR